MNDMTTRLWDISPPVDAKAPVFPGDTAYRQAWTMTLSPNGFSFLS